MVGFILLISLVKLCPVSSSLWAFSNVKYSINLFASYVLFNKSLALYISVLSGFKSMFKSFFFSWVCSPSSSLCCVSSSSGGSSSLSVWFASFGSSSSVLSSVVVSIVCVLIISSSSSKIGVVSSGGSGFNIYCIRL